MAVGNVMHDLAKGVNLFFKHYLPRIERGSELTADGWFKDG